MSTSFSKRARISGKRLEDGIGEGHEPPPEDGL
jgi:hypothetical protein